jgi:uncharacterized protein
LSGERRSNRLINEKSLYLLEHAFNPVEWYPWGDEAFVKAKRENKPIFLSIGYSTCHWCHVMAHESFENDGIASILNKNFVSIKVDREERPEIDEIYMRAVMSMHGQGGWPLSVFLTPELKPFYGGTYFPPVPRHGLPAFPQLLEFISDLWAKKRDEIIKDSEELTRSLQSSYSRNQPGELTTSVLDECYGQLISVFDEQYGGFSTAPKFPLPNYLEFLLRYYKRSKKETALKVVKRTLQCMAAGGIHDQLGGGFHRYSTDRFWLVPHFEKMLYDNAQLAKVYLEAFQLTGDDSLISTATDTLEWMLREMRSPEGGFYSAQDADTPDGEGFYYTWTPEELRKALGAEDSRMVQEFYRVTDEGNFEDGRSILSVNQGLKQVVSKHGPDPDATGQILKNSKAKLLAVRQTRRRPLTDDKVISSWNGLAISAFASAYQVTGQQKYLDAASDAAGFLLHNLMKGDRLMRRYQGGEVAFEGALEDYAFVVSALIDMYETTFHASWLRQGIALTEKMIELFWDSAAGGFFNSSGDLILKVKDSYDGPTPSGNSVAALSLLRLSGLTGEENYRLKAEQTLKIFSNAMEASPSSHTYLMCALDFWFGSREIVVAGPIDDSFSRQAKVEIWKRYLPDKVLASTDGTIPEIRQLTEGKTTIGGRPAIYICRNFACRSPITDLASLGQELDA